MLKLNSLTRILLGADPYVAHNQGVGNGQNLCKETLRKHSPKDPKTLGNTQETLTKRPENTEKHSGNTHEKDLKTLGNTQETPTRKTQKR